MAKYCNKFTVAKSCLKPTFVKVSEKVSRIAVCVHCIGCVSFAGDVTLYYVGKSMECIRVAGMGCNFFFSIIVLNWLVSRWSVSFVEGLVFGDCIWVALASL